MELKKFKKLNIFEKEIKFKTTVLKLYLIKNLN